MPNNPIKDCGRIADDVVRMSVPCYRSDDPLKTIIKPYLHVPNGLMVGDPDDPEEGGEQWTLPEGWQAALVWGGKHD